MVLLWHRTGRGRKSERKKGNETNFDGRNHCFTTCNEDVTTFGDFTRLILSVPITFANPTQIGSI